MKKHIKGLPKIHSPLVPPKRKQPMVSHKPLFSIEMYVVGRQGLEARTKGL
jgi:hypothetical protein